MARRDVYRGCVRERLGILSRAAPKVCGSRGFSHQAQEFHANSIFLFGVSFFLWWVAVMIPRLKIQFSGVELHNAAPEIGANNRELY